MKALLLGFLIALLLPSQGSAKTLPKNIWSLYYKKFMTKNLCEKGEYYRSCFRMSEKQCKKNVSVSLSTCFKKQRIPSSVNVNKAGVRLGYDIGICTGKDLDQRFQKKKLNKAVCSEAWRWQ